MITCLECLKGGFKVLKHTHFKHQCIGTVKNLTEYLLKHPGAKTTSDEVSSKVTHSKNNFILRHGEEAGQQLWAEYCKKHSVKNTLAGYLAKGKTEEDWKQYNSAKSATLENFKRRYGANGEARWEQYCELQRKNGCQLEWFIEKHGAEAGLIAYHELNKKKGITPENLIRVHGVEQGLIKWHAWLESTNGARISKLQREIINEIIPILPTEYMFHDGVFSGKEFCVNSKAQSRPYMYDFVITNPVKICIEINGDFWHANPLLYKATDRLRHRGGPKEGYLASEIWETDKKKRLAIEARGYTMHYIWEHDWLTSKHSILEKVKIWLQQK